MNQVPTSPLQVLYLDADLELELSASSQRAFGFPLTVNRVAGGSIHLHVGSAEGHGEPLPTNSEYRRAISKLPLLQQEGDGVRSYMGVLLSVTGANYPLVLIDEPEAFLHPPQARQLGRELTRLVGAETQLIAGTHSADFLEGVLDSSQGSVTVIRLTRDGDDVSAAVLDRAQLEEVWSDPLLRYSRLLDGLFHVGVVLCESDSDCRFYEATLDSCLERAGQRPHDLLFTHTGGKHRLPAAIAALNAIDVPVQAVADFDVLSDEGLLKRLVDGLDGDWSALETDWRIVTSAVRQLGKAPPILAVREDVRAALDAAEGPTLTKDVAKRIRESTKIEDAWERTKAGGLAVLPQGEAISAAERLLGALAGIGLHVVPVGELERWAPEIGGHGPAWVAGTLEAKKHEETGGHADFVQGFAGY